VIKQMLKVKIRNLERKDIEAQSLFYCFEMLDSEVLDI